MQNLAGFENTKKENIKIRNQKRNKQNKWNVFFCYGKILVKFIVHQPTTVVL